MPTDPIDRREFVKLSSMAGLGMSFMAAPASPQAQGTAPAPAAAAAEPEKKPLKPDAVRKTPFPDLPQRFDFDDLQGVMSALGKNKLWYWQRGGFVGQLRDHLRKMYAPYWAATTSSGTASLHVAMAAGQIPPGTEVITSPITDAGTIIAILYQNAIPVFADVDPLTSNITADSIDAVITERTRAVIVVHLTGCPAEMGPIVDLCKRRNLVLIEDCAQALGATYGGKQVGTLGDFGCYSLNDQKHITCGEGGYVLTNTEERFYLCHNYADKYYDRHRRGVRLHGLGPNYRMSEIDGALGLAQFNYLDSVVSRRRRLGDHLTERITGIPGIVPPGKPAGAEASYFFYMFRIDPSPMRITRDEFIAKLGEEGIPASGGYTPWPLYKAPMFLNKSFFPGGIWPAEAVSGRTYDYKSIHLPQAELALNTAITLDLHEGFSIEDIEDCATAIRKVAEANIKR